MKQIATAKPAPSPVIEDDSDGDDGLMVFRQIAESVSSSDKKKVVTKTKKKAVTKRQVKSIKERCRKRFSFWLEMDKVEQVDLREWFKDLKLRREFTPVIRIAVSLYRQLLAGDTTMLYQCFPNLKPEQPAQPAPSPEVDELKKRVAILEGQVTILQQVIISTRLPTAIDQKMSGGNGATMSEVVDVVPVRTPRPTIHQRPSVVVDAAPVQEADTSEAFLSAF